MNTTPASTTHLSSQTLHIQHLMIQREHLLLLRDRHLKWMGATHSPEIRKMHSDLAGLIDDVAAEYEQLCTALQEQKAREEESTERAV